MKLINTNKSLFNMFTVYINKKGELIIKIDNADKFKASFSNEWVKKHIKSVSKNQHGTFIKLNHSVKVKNVRKTIYSFLGLKLQKDNEFYYCTGGKFGAMQLFKGCTDKTRLRSHWKGYVNNSFPSFARV